MGFPPETFKLNELYGEMLQWMGDLCDADKNGKTDGDELKVCLKSWALAH